MYQAKTQYPHQLMIHVRTRNTKETALFLYCSGELVSLGVISMKRKNARSKCYFILIGLFGCLAYMLQIFKQRFIQDSEDDD